MEKDRLKRPITYDKFQMGCIWLHGAAALFAAPLPDSNAKSRPFPIFQQAIPEIAVSSCDKPDCLNIDHMASTP